MKRADAFERQVQASDPSGSVWLSANAGSGKTRVLTDRVARLLLRGVEPQHILCLTYTKAAATEMQNRLFRRLGEWAMKPDAELHRALQELGDDGRHGHDLLARARRLFARAIETPGGLRIQTIHSFCAGLLRRFPLEAGVSPQFTELDDRAARLLRESLIDELAGFRAPEMMAEVALAHTGEDFTALMEQVVSNRAGFSRPVTEAELAASLGAAPGDDVAKILADVFLGDEPALVAALAPVLMAGKPTDRKLAGQLGGIDLAAPSLAGLAALEDLFLFKADAKTPFAAKLGSLPTKDARAALGTLLPRLEAWMQRVEAARPRRIARLAVRKSLALHRFAEAFLPLYEAAKAARGVLDFDDLIARTSALLTNPDVAAWVLYRLDGGIDHILVDEAQDTSPGQWRVIELLAAEFTAGESARPEARTLFVVGDKKQSIYSFQGANVAAFDDKHAAFQASFRAAGQAFASHQLEYSFRSAEAVLRIVDATFGGRFPVALGGVPNHLAFKTDLPGRVDLWPMIEASPPVSDDAWEDPVDLISEDHHSARLASQIAREIAAMIARGAHIPVDRQEHPDGHRAVHEGDFLILVQRRSTLFSEIIRACKKEGLAIAGADRLKLGAELAVKDLAALLAFLATPEDDLALAALLRSPLCGWTEAELYALAQPRKGYLWQALRESKAQPETLAMLEDLRNQADYLRPFDLIERALTRHDGRRRLLARLGPEAEDGIDEFLAQALAFERSDVPSLTAFLIWLETDDLEAKRQMDSEGRRIRVMTVHGAKGLEAPVVILPDTADRNPQDRDEVYRLTDGLPVWKTAADESPVAIAAARAERQARAEEENLRLLYVALTRARCWLIVCGAGTARKEGAWHRLVREGLAATGSENRADGRLRLANGAWPDDGAEKALTQLETVALPAWLDHPAPAVVHPPQPLAPSDLGGEKVIAGESDAVGAEAAKVRGTALHLLLQHLPGVPAPARAALAETLLPDAAQRADVLPEVLAILDTPALAPIFAAGSRAEAGFAADFRGRPLTGSIDRLVVAGDRVLAVDYKSNRLVPQAPEDVPEGLLRQLGAYAHALGQIYPERRIETAILWTRSATLMPLDPDMVREALERTAIP